MRAPSPLHLRRAVVPRRAGAGGAPPVSRLRESSPIRGKNFRPDRTVPHRLERCHSFQGIRSNPSKQCLSKSVLCCTPTS